MASRPTLRRPKMEEAGGNYGPTPAIQLVIICNQLYNPWGGNAQTGAEAECVRITGQSALST